MQVQTTSASVVAGALAELILTTLLPGMSLPSEADLALRFGVSRLTLREAVKIVAGRGLIDVGRGRRAIVRQPSGVGFSDYLSMFIQADAKGLFDVIELRMSLEVQAAGLAARRRTRAGLAGLASALDGMKEAAAAVRSGTDVLSNEIRFDHHDVAFHEAVALSSGNRLISYLFEGMATPLRRSFLLSRQGHALRGHAPEDTIVAHQLIFDAIASSDPKRASAAMRDHLEDTARDIRLALGASDSGSEMR
jgi:DNA-binding FadR family transcriptional regulator